MTPERQQAHALLDLLPDHKLQGGRGLLEITVKPSGASLATAPVEEEEIMPETAAALNRAETSLARGEEFAHEDILHDFDFKRGD